MLAHPLVAKRSSGECIEWTFDSRGRRKEKRPPGIPTPCHKCPKIVDGTLYELNEKNRKAYQHYRVGRPAGQSTVAPIVPRNAAIIHGVEEDHHRAELLLRIEAVGQGVGAKVRK